MPQHCEELVQATPWPEQPPLVQIAPLQVRVPQHWGDDVQEPPLFTQPLLPTQTPPEQVRVPQHCDDAVQNVPAPWQPPSVQILLALQVSVSQQSELLPQT